MVAVDKIAYSRGIYYGYYIFGIVFLAQMLTIGLVSLGFGIFVKPIIAEFGISRTGANGGLMIILIGMAAGSPFVGRLVDRYPAQYIMSAGAVLFGLGLIAIALSKSLTMITVLLVVPVSLSAVTISHLMTSTLISRWFGANRGRILGLAAISGSMSGIVVVPLLAYLVEHEGWRVTLALFGGFEALVIGSLALLVVRSRPPFDFERQSEVTGPGLAVRSRAYTAGELLRTRDFWLISLSIGLLMGIDQALYASIIPYGQDRGLSLRHASTLVSIIAAAAVVGKIISGYLCDRIDKRWPLWAAVILTVVFMLILTSRPSEQFLYVACGSAGMAIGGTMPVWYSAVAHRFGTITYGTALGLMVPIHLPIALSAVWLAGAVRDATGNYDMAFLIFAGLAVLAGFIIVPVAMRKPVDRNAQTPTPQEHRASRGAVMVHRRASS